MPYAVLLYLCYVKKLSGIRGKHSSDTWKTSLPYWKNYISSLKMYISKLDLYISSLEIYKSSVKIQISYCMGKLFHRSCGIFCTDAVNFLR